MLRLDYLQRAKRVNFLIDKKTEPPSGLTHITFLRVATAARSKRTMHVVVVVVVVVVSEVHA